jgi:hypothetical protein
MFCLNLLLILESQMLFYQRLLQKHFCIIGWCLVIMLPMEVEGGRQHDAQVPLHIGALLFFWFEDRCC